MITVASEISVNAACVFNTDTIQYVDIRSHSVIFHQTHMNTTRLHPVKQDGTRFTYSPEGIRYPVSY